MLWACHIGYIGRHIASRVRSTYFCTAVGTNRVASRTFFSSRLSNFEFCARVDELGIEAYEMVKRKSLQFNGMICISEASATMKERGPRHQRVRAGTTTTLPCNLSPGVVLVGGGGTSSHRVDDNPPPPPQPPRRPTIEWRRDDEPLPVHSSSQEVAATRGTGTVVVGGGGDGGRGPGRKFYGKDGDNDSLTIVNATSSDTGLYTCVDVTLGQHSETLFGVQLIVEGRYPTQPRHRRR